MVVGDDKEEGDKDDKEEDVNGDDKIKSISGIGWKIRFFLQRL